MAGRPAVEELRQRKQALIVESDLNRFTLRIEYENLRVAAKPLDDVSSAARRMGPWLLPLAPLAGLLAAGFLRKRSGFLNSLTSLLRWLPPALALWRQFGTAGEKQPKPDAG